MPKNRVSGNGANESDVSIQESSADVSVADGGVKVPPYPARWITIKDVATLAGVTGQTVRNAYKDHPAFNTPGVTEADPTSPRWFVTKMVDQFGNVTDYDVIYIEHAAALEWIDARAQKPAPAQHGGAKRYIIRLTQEQVNALPAEEGTLPSIALPDGTLVQLELPPVGNRKPKGKNDPTTTTDATSDLQIGVAADMPVQQSSDIFDVELDEVPA
jgi:hypothetical protein